MHSPKFPALVVVAALVLSLSGCGRAETPNPSLPFIVLTKTGAGMAGASVLAARSIPYLRALYLAQRPGAVFGCAGSAVANGWCSNDTADGYVFIAADVETGCTSGRIASVTMAGDTLTVATQERQADCSVGSGTAGPDEMWLIRVPSGSLAHGLVTVRLRHRAVGSLRLPADGETVLDLRGDPGVAPEEIEAAGQEVQVSGGRPNAQVSGRIVQVELILGLASAPRPCEPVTAATGTPPATVRFIVSGSRPGEWRWSQGQLTACPSAP